MSLRALLCVALLLFAGLLVTSVLAQPPKPAVPSPAEVADLLRREPLTPTSWPTWRARLLAWIGDRGQHTDAAYDAARVFLKEQAGAGYQLPPALASDAFAWYLLSTAYLYDRGAEANTRGDRAEPALRRSLQLDPSFARAHRNLALALLLQDAPTGLPRVGMPRPDLTARRREAQQELEQAHRLDPALPLKGIEAEVALEHKQFVEAERLFQEAQREDPQEVHLALGQAVAIISNQQRSGPRAPTVKKLCDQFPDDGTLACLHGLALAEDDDPRAAVREFERARSLGTDPAAVFSPELVAKIEEAGAPGLLERLGWTLAAFAGFYTLVMGLMAFFGLVLASRTRGIRALDLLGSESNALVTAGQVVRTRHESGLAKVYALALFTGLVLFYLSIPFVLGGLVAFTGLLLYLIFLLPRIPIKLIVIVVVVGLGGAWAVLKGLFARTGQGSFGLPKTANDCPRLFQALNEVAQRVDTEPVDDVYLAPGASIGVYQEGRGPFGLFGVKRRVLTLGLCTLHYLTVGELKAILAHEYAHFSHRDTFFNRFIYQVKLSIQQALDGMGQTGGRFNYVNPFYWFLIAYYKAYDLLAAGYSRSREFLADRMASSLYGSDVFASALTKVSTDGSLFEMTVYKQIAELLGEGKAFVNMYVAFRSFRDEQLSQQEREDLYHKLLDDKASLFDSHPTFGERLEAVASLPKATTTETETALGLFDNAEAVEKELTDFLTDYMHYVQQLRARAAAG